MTVFLKKLTDEAKHVPVLDKGFIRLVDSMPECLLTEDLSWSTWDLRVVEAARASYQQPSKGVEKDKKLLQYLFEHGHTSVFEHITLTFEIKQPIFVARQWMRYRHASINEQSLRYIQVQEDEYYIPDYFREQSVNNKQGSGDLFYNEELKNSILQHYQEADSLYQKLIAQGVARELARIVRPVAAYTQFYWTANMRSILHLLDERTDNHAQYEIRQYAYALRDIIEAAAPHTINTWKRLKTKA